jgi:hypothetical protein
MKDDGQIAGEYYAPLIRHAGKFAVFSLISMFLIYIVLMIFWGIKAPEGKLTAHDALIGAYITLMNLAIITPIFLTTLIVFVLRLSHSRERTIKVVSLAVYFTFLLADVLIVANIDSIVRGFQEGAQEEFQRGFQQGYERWQKAREP